AARFLHHGYLIYVQRAVFQLAGHAHVVAFVSLERILIVDVQHALVFLGNKNQLGAVFSSFLGAIGIIYVLHTALLIAHPSAHLGGFGFGVLGKGRDRDQERGGEQHQGNSLHG